MVVMHLKAMSAATAILLCTSLTTFAGAHSRDLMGPAGAGPIRRDETTMGQLRKWFGTPTARKVVRVGCVRVIKARWGKRLKVYAWRGKVRRVAAVFVKSPALASRTHGRLRIHTRKGLRVDDRRAKLRRLYPRAKPITHAGHTHYRLKTGRYGSYLMAKVVNRRVVRLEAWPYEFC